VSSPLLANLFLHYAFDCWISGKLPKVPCERYAGDIVCHVPNFKEAQAVRNRIARRFKEVGLEINESKSKIVARNKHLIASV
jgi:RNA-directed DNA polymerase